MRLIFDLRLASAADPDDPSVRRMALEDVASSPRDLAEALWRSRFDEVVIERDDLPLSGVQAAIQVIAGFARSGSFSVNQPSGRQTMGRAGFLSMAIRRAAVELPRELALVARLNRRATRIGATNFNLPRAVKDASSAVYLRAEPTLRWKGSFVGGAATHTTGVINGFARNGVDLTVYAPEEIPGIHGVKAVIVKPKRMLHLAHWMTLTEFTRDLAKAATRNPVGFVYQRYALGSYAGLEIARKLKVPLILEFNGSEIWAQQAWGNSKLRFLEPLTKLERRNLEDASLIIVVSQVLKDQLVDQGIAAERILANPNGVEVERLAAYRDDAPAAWRERLGEQEAPTIGFIGSFGLWHGVKLLPAMIEAVKAKRPDARWIIVGDGQLFAEVEADINRRGLADQVTLTGIVEHESGLQHLAACDVCVSPHVPNEDGSRFFGSPTKLFEYMGLGKPIVASDLEQIGEVIQHERNGLLCEPGDVEAQADAVVRLLNEPELARRLADAALEEAQSSYSWEAHVRRILDAIGSDAGDKPQGTEAAAGL